jgi:site-specific recombinase XerD
VLLVTTAPAPAADPTAPSDIGFNLESFARHLRAENRAPSTIATYAKAVTQLDVYLREGGMPISVANVRREHIESFLVSLQDRGRRPATVANRFRSLQQFFRWLKDEDEIRESPMANMRAPTVPDAPPAVLRESDLKRLLATCAGREFDERRDNALLRLFIDTGIRRGELAGLRLEDIDFNDDVALVTGKGRRPRACPFGRKTAQALDRYLRARARHPNAIFPVAVARQTGATDRQRYRAGGSPPWARCWAQGPTSPTHLPPHLRASVAGERRDRRRPDAPRRLEEPTNARPVRGFRSG